MKKILFLLLATSISYGQTTLANKLKITGNVTDNAATKVNVQDATGLVNTIAKEDLVDYLEYTTASALPVTGVVGKLYLTKDDNKIYRWSGSVYVNAGGSGDMTLGTAQTVTALKTFNNSTLGLRNVANTFTSLFTNTNTAARTYTLQNRDITFAGTDEISWTKSSNDIYNNNSGNIGIGTSTGLTARVNIKGTTTADGTRGIQLTDSSNALMFYVNNSGQLNTTGSLTGQGGVFSSLSFYVANDGHGLVGNNSKSILNQGTNWLCYGEMRYGSDYSGAYTSRSLVDKAYVDSKRIQRLAQYTVSTLPAGVQGDNAYVTDALAPTYMAAVVGGGSVITPVFYNGTNWIAH